MAKNDFQYAQRGTIMTLISPVDCTLQCGISDRQYFGCNFDKFRQLFMIFGKNRSDNPCD